MVDENKPIDVQIGELEQQGFTTEEAINIIETRGPDFDPTTEFQPDDVEAAIAQEEAASAGEIARAERAAALQAGIPERIAERQRLAGRDLEGNLLPVEDISDASILEQVGTAPPDAAPPTTVTDRKLQAAAQIEAEKRLKLESQPEVIEVKTETEWQIDLEKQPVELRDAFKSGGIDAYNKAYEDWGAKHLFIGDYAIPIATWNQMPERYQTIAIRQGYPAVIEAFEIDKKEHDAQVEEQNKALQTLVLAGFAAQKPELAKRSPFEPLDNPAELDYNIIGYFKDNPNQKSVDVIDAAGFDKDTVNSAQVYVNTFRDGLAELDQDLSVETAKATGGIGNADPTALIRALRQLDIPVVTGSGVVTWRLLSDDEKVEVYKIYADDPGKRNVFATVLANWNSIKKNLNDRLDESGAPKPVKFAGQLANELYFIGPTILAGVGDVTREELKKVPDVDTFEWRNVLTSDVISNEEHNKLGSNIERDNYVLTSESQADIPLVTLPGQLAKGTIDFVGGAIQGRRTPEGIAQIIFIAAPLVKPAIIRGKVAFTGKVEVPLPEGPVTVWRGLKLGDNPIVGLSKGKPAVGTSGITLPPLRDWELPGREGRPFEPRTGVDTKVLVNNTLLEKAGLTDPRTFVENIELTLSQVRQFEGKESPFMAPELLTAPIDTFSAKGVETIMRDAVENKAIVDKIFGSTTIRPQLSPTALKEWTEKFGRTPGDIDIFLKNVDQAGAEAYAARLVERIKSESGDIAWVSPENPTLVRAYSRTTGANRHAIDIHYPGEPALEASITPSQFGEMVYGIKKAAPEVKVNLPEIGEISIARLSETGVGKTEQVLGWRRDPATGEVVLKTEAHRMKDYVDLFEIIKTYNGEAAAAKWAADIGITDILKQLEKEGKFAGAPGEFSDIAWEFRPSEVGSIGSLPTSIPTISIIAPGYISASRSVPVGVTSKGVFVTAPSIVASSIPSEVSVATRPSVAPSVPPSRIADEPPSIPPSEPPSPPEPSEPPSPPEPSIPPSEPPSPPEPSIPPSPPEPPEPPSPPVEDGGSRFIPLPDDKGEEKPKKVQPGTPVWIQGRPEGGAMYKILEPPYTKIETSRIVPEGYIDEGWSGEGMAFKSLQVLGGMPDRDIKNVDLGFAKINILNKGGKPVIEYSQDIEANVGDRSRTVGMGDGQIPIDAWNEAKETGVQFEDFVRTYNGPRVGGAERETAVVEETIATSPRSVPADTPRVLTDKELMARISKQNGRQWWDDTSNLYPEGHPRRRPPPPGAEPRPTYRGRDIISPDLGGEI